MLRALILPLLVAVLAPLAGAQSVWHVDDSATPGGDGYSWPTALTALDQALALASDGDQVWVAEGTYQPRVPRNPADLRTSAFSPVDGVELYGGFAGHETSLAARAGLYEQTILDGDIGAPGEPSDNAYHVLFFEGNGAHHVLDGFQIQNGNANGAGISKRGGALYSILGTKFIRNCRFTRNRAVHGGAIDSSGGLVFLSWCTFDGNCASSNGGAIRASFDIWAASCVFRNNTARGSGGALFLFMNTDYFDGTPRPTFQSCLFHHNRASRGGAACLGNGGVSNTPGQANFSGCTLVQNQARLEGGAICTPPTYLLRCDCRVRNCVVWKNSAPLDPELSGDPGHYQVAYSNLTTGWPGLGNLRRNPRFESVALQDYRLRSGSPCIDAGDSSLVTPDYNDVDADGDYTEPTPYDLVGDDRFYNDLATPDTGAGPPPITDLGCYEYRP